jgi:cytochrome P450
MGAVGDKQTPVHFDRHSADYAHRFAEIAHNMQAQCPVGWTDAYGGYWVATGYKEVFELARHPSLLSNDRDTKGERKGYLGISIPANPETTRAGFLEMDPPEQRDYRRALDPYLSPAAVARWKPMAEDLTRACLDERIESGRIDFVDDLANVVPAVMTCALMGLPLVDWVVYCEPTHALLYTPPDSPDLPRVLAASGAAAARMAASVAEIRRAPRPGMVNALIEASICGLSATDEDIRDAMFLLIGGGFDTTTALTAHSLEWLSEHPAERARLRADLAGLIDTATEEFLRVYTPAPGDGRTVTCTYELSGKQLEEGDRLYLSFAMANRDPSVFPDPDSVLLDRKGNRHAAFGLGLHRCIGSNVARAVFKTMLSAVLERMPDYRCDPTGAVRYDTVGVINGMKHVPATFTPGVPVGPSLDDTIARWQNLVDEQRMAEPIARASQQESTTP